MLIVVKVIQCYVLYYVMYCTMLCTVLCNWKTRVRKKPQTHFFEKCKTVVEDRKGSQNYTLLTKIK